MTCEKISTLLKSKKKDVNTVNCSKKGSADFWKRFVFSAIINQNGNDEN